MKSREQPQDNKIFTCPQCDKHRMIRPLGFVVSQDMTEYKTRDGSMVKLFNDTCINCMRRNYRQYFEPTRSDVRKVLKAMKDDTKPSDVSLEELL